MNGWTEVLNVGSIGAGGLVAIFLVAVWRGWLIPERQVTKLVAAANAAAAAKDVVVAQVTLAKDEVIKQIREDRDAQLARMGAEVAEWRGAWRTEQTARQQLQDQNGELLELARTGAHAFTSIAAAAEQHDG